MRFFVGLILGTLLSYSVFYYLEEKKEKKEKEEFTIENLEELLGVEIEDDNLNELKKDLMEILSQQTKLLKKELNNLTEENERDAINIQYVEIKGKKAYVKLHLGMPKSEAEELLGKADKVKLRSSLNTYYEEWRYHIKTNHTNYLDLDFKNGLLERVNQW